jgi:hypothetical protein
MHRLETRIKIFEVCSKLHQIFLIWILYLFHEATTYHCSRFGTLEPDALSLNVSVRSDVGEQHK